MIKKLLFIGVGFHCYDSILVKELEKTYNVYYIDSLEYFKSSNFFIRFIKRVLHCKNKKEVVSHLITQRLHEIKDIVFNEIFIIKGEGLDESHLNFLMNNWSTSRKILYLWDAFREHVNKELLIKYFDTIYSFDPIDCKKYGFRFRPLFYNQIKVENSQYNASYFVSCIGSYNDERLMLLRRIKALCREYNLPFHLSLYIDRKQYLKYLLKFKYSSFDKNILTYKIIPFNKYLEITNHSQCVIDIPKIGQHGLTMRTLESIASGKYLITTNLSIKEHPFIPQECYSVLSSSENLVELKNIQPYHYNILKDFLAFYSVRQFLADLNL